MAKNIPNVDLLTETFDTWLNRTNDVINLIGSEVITANATLGVTGTPTVPLKSRLWGEFTANNLTATTTLSVPNSFSATPSGVSINTNISLNGVSGSNGQILASNGSSLYWTSLRIDTAANSGLEGGPITSTGSLKVKAGTGIRVDSTGVSANVQFIQSQITSVPLLNGFSWDSPSSIGSTTANTGKFTVVTADNYRITNTTTDNFLISAALIRINGTIDSTTPGNGIDDTRGAVTIRARGTGRSLIQFTNQSASAEYGNLSVDSSGVMRYNGNKVVTVNDFITDVGSSAQQWTKLPNGLILQWGSMSTPGPGGSSSISLLPTSYISGYQVFISPLGDYEDNDDGNEMFYAQPTGLTFFTFYNATAGDNTPTNFSWFTIGY